MEGGCSSYSHIHFIENIKSVSNSSFIAGPKFGLNSDFESRYSPIVEATHIPV